ARAHIQSCARTCRAGHRFASPLATQRQKPGRAGRRSYSDADGICQRPTALPIRPSRASIGGDERRDVPNAAEPAQSVVRRGHDADRRRATPGEALPPPVRPRTAGAGHRSPVSPAHRPDRPAGGSQPRRPGLRDVVPDTVVTAAVTVDRHRPPPPHRPRAPYQVYASDETGDLTLTYFNARKDYLQKLLPVGERRYVSGTVALYDHMRQMVHPDRVVAEADLAKLPLVE